MHQFVKFILFCSSTLHVSDGLSESKNVHTASSIRQTDSADCLLAGMRWNISFPRCQAHIVPDNIHQLHVQQPSMYEKPEAASAVLGS
jgi:hypothetical protein